MGLYKLDMKPLTRKQVRLYADLYGIEHHWWQFTSTIRKNIMRKIGENINTTIENARLGAIKRG